MHLSPRSGGFVARYASTSCEKRHLYMVLALLCASYPPSLSALLHLHFAKSAWFIACCRFTKLQQKEINISILDSKSGYPIPWWYLQFSFCHAVHSLHHGFALVCPASGEIGHYKSRFWTFPIHLIYYITESPLLNFWPSISSSPKTEVPACVSLPSLSTHFSFRNLFLSTCQILQSICTSKNAAEAYSALIGASPGLRSSVAIADQDQSKNTQKKLYEIFVRAEALDNLFSRSC